MKFKLDPLSPNGLANRVDEQTFIIGSTSTSSTTTSANVDWGPDFGESSDNNTWNVGVDLTMPTLALEHSKTVGAQLTMPALALQHSKSVGVHLSGTALGAPFYQSVSTVDSTTAGTTVTINKPSGTVEGDFMLAFIMNNNLGAITEPSGWTLIRNDQRDGTLDCQVSSYYKFAGASEPASYAWTITSGANFGSIHRLTGVDVTTPVNVSTGGNANVADPVVPAATTTAVNCMIFVVCAQNSAVDVTYTQPAGYTERSDQNGLGGAGAHLLDGSTAQLVQAASGDTGTSTIDSSTLVAIDSAYQRVCIAPGTVTLAA